jgi:hypothetical protein
MRHIARNNVSHGKMKIENIFAVGIRREKYAGKLRNTKSKCFRMAEPGDPKDGSDARTRLGLWGTREMSLYG